MLFDLLPCPFCGGAAFMVEDRGERGREPTLYRPQCKSCGSNSGGLYTRRAAAAFWNTRAAPQPRGGAHGDA